ncbi:MAG: aryl-sulfate sulfotransferase, partial [FCB group bacterium]
MNRHISFLLVWLIMVLMNSIITNQLIASNIKSTVTALDNPAPGYLRLDWAAPGNFFLVDNYGFIQYRDSINLKPSIHFKPLSNGLWITDSCNKYYIFNNALQYIDSIPFPSSYQIDFHDVNILSNSHYLLLCRQDTIIDMSKIIDGGLNNTLVHSAVLVETDRTGTIYWIWKAIDHLKLTDVTPDVDLHSQPIDFTHANAITEDSVGNIFLSLRFLDDIIKIDKSTGNIIWHLGGSKCKNNEFTFINDSIYGFTGFSHQHCISVLPNGNLLLFD